MTYYRFIDGAGNPVSELINVSFTAGKQALLDIVSASTGSFTFRRVTGNATQLDAIIPGDQVDLEFSNNGTSWSGLASQFVTDVTVRWGNPTTGPVYNDDYVTVTTEGCLASWGRASTNLQVAAGAATAQLAQVDADVGLGYSENFSTYNDPTLYAYTIAGSALDYLQLLATTTNCRFDDYSGVIVDIKSPYNFSTSSWNFTDQSSGANLLYCQSIEFDSLASNYYNQVLLSIGDLGWPASATDTGASQPYRILQLPTIWGTALDATGFAEYLLDLYKAPAQEISSVTCLTEAQGNSRLAQEARSCIGRKYSIAFRGTTIYGICEGFTMTASPGTSTYQFYFSTSAQDVPWLILDSSTQGKLDVNKLGF